MGLGSKKRDYKSEDRKIKSRLQRFDARVKELVEGGMSEEEADKVAFREIAYPKKKRGV